VDIVRLANLQLINAAAVPIIRVGRHTGGGGAGAWRWEGVGWVEWSGVKWQCFVWLFGWLS